MISENRNYHLGPSENSASPATERGKNSYADGLNNSSNLLRIIEQQQKIIEILEKELESIPEIIIRYQTERQALNQRFTHSNETVVDKYPPNARADLQASYLKCPDCIGDIFYI